MSKSALSATLASSLRTQKSEDRIPGTRRGRRVTESASADEVLKSVLSSYGLDSELAKFQFMQHWDQVVGAKLARHTRPVSLSNGILVLEVSHSSWAQELVFLKDSLVKRVQSYLSDRSLVRDVRFYVTGKRHF